MIHKCICSQYSLKAPHPQNKNKNGTEATAQQAGSWEAEAAPEGEALRPAGPPRRSRTRL